MIFEYKASSPKPFMNENSWTFANGMRGVYNTQPFDYSWFMKMIKSNPEAIGILRAMVTDILSDGVVWKGGKNKILKAKAWAQKKQLWSRKLPAGMLDWFIYGNNLIWTGMDFAKVKEMVYKEINSNKEFKGSMFKDEIANKMISDMSEKALDYRNVPWSTVTIDTDATDVTGFSQNMGTTIANTGISMAGPTGNERKWKANEVIHAVLMDMDGKAYGFSPMVALTSTISTLALIKDYNGYKFDNGGEPDLIFSFPNEIADNPNVKALVRHLEEKRLSRNKGGHLVMTGEVNVTPVSDHNKDMEYRLLAVYYTGIMAFAFNMPIGRIQSILGSEINTGGQELSDSGYWRSISHMQTYWEELLNTHIFEPEFGVSFKFKRSYKQDEVREAQVMQMKATAIGTMISSLRIKPSKNYLKEAFGFDDDDIEWKWYEKLDPEKVAMPASSPKNDGSSQPKNREVMNSDGKNSADDKKKNVMNGRTNVP